MGQAQSNPTIDQSVLKYMSVRYNQFLPLYVTRKKSNCPAAPSECELYSTLYIQLDGLQSALGYVDSTNSFQATTSNMSFARTGEHKWCLVGTLLADGEIVVLKYESGDYTLTQHGFTTKLHIH